MILTVKKSKKKKKTAILVFGVAAGAFAAAIAVYAGLHAYVPAAVLYEGEDRNPYLREKGNALVTAHRSGGGIFPENTLLAFKSCVASEDFHTDAFEFDLHTTKDGYLLVLHDGTLDRTTNAVEHFGEKKIRASDKTYAELRELNFGEYYTDAEGNQPYKGLRGADIPDDLRAVTLEEVLDYMEGVKPYYYVIDIKDGGETGCKGVDKLVAILKERNMLDRVIFGNFNGDVIRYVDENHPELQRSSSPAEVLQFYFNCLVNKKLDAGDIPYMALQIPANQFKIFRLGTKKFLDYAHRYNLAVQYWTINDEPEIRRLNEIGADAIMTDYPDLAYKIIK